MTENVDSLLTLPHFAQSQHLLKPPLLLLKHGEVT